MGRNQEAFTPRRYRAKRATITTVLHVENEVQERGDKEKKRKKVSSEEQIRERREIFQRVYMRRGHYLYCDTYGKEKNINDLKRKRKNSANLDWLILTRRMSSLIKIELKLVC